MTIGVLLFASFFVEPTAPILNGLFYACACHNDPRAGKRSQSAENERKKPERLSNIRV